VGRVYALNNPLRKVLDGLGVVLEPDLGLRAMVRPKYDAQMSSICKSWPVQLDNLRQHSSLIHRQRARIAAARSGRQPQASEARVEPKRFQLVNEWALDRPSYPKEQFLAQFASSIKTPAGRSTCGNTNVCL
jgi:hypothetical protein